MRAPVRNTIYLPPDLVYTGGIRAVRKTKTKEKELFPVNYDFNTAHTRVGMEAAKWDELGPDPAPGVVPLSVADMELLSPPEIVEALKKTAEFGMWGYTKWGKPYADAVKHWMSTRHGWEVQQDWIVQTNGVVQGLYAAVRAYTRPGDKALILTPVYPPFYQAVEKNGRTVVESPLKLENGRYEVDFDDFEEKARSCKLFILCSPHNPVGRVWTERELRRMGDICLKHGVLVISDEIHFDLVMPGYKHVSYPTLGKSYADSCVMFTAASKTFSLAGLCVANAIIPNAQLRQKLEEQVQLSGCNTFSIFGIRALETGYWQCADWVDQLNGHIWGNYRYLKDFMAEHFPDVWVAGLEGTYLAWFDCRCFGMDGHALGDYLREKAGLYLDDGYIFGEAGDGWQRLNLACPRKVLEEALDRFQAAMDQLKQ